MLHRSLVAVVLIAAPLGAHARVVDAQAHGMTIVNEVTVPVDANVAWDGLVNHVDAWWPRDHTWFPGSRLSIEPRAGGCFCERAGGREAWHMAIGFVDPGATLRMLGGLGPLQGLGLTGALDWKLAPVDGGTKITLHYVVGGYTTQDLKGFAPIVDQVQGVQLGGLAKFLAQRAAPAAERRP